MRFITCLIGIGMLAACASSAPRDANDAAAKRASEAQAERDLARDCRLADAQGRSDTRCPSRPPRASRNPNLPLELPVELPGGLL
jgi:hypothetical protein